MLAYPASGGSAPSGPEALKDPEIMMPIRPCHGTLVIGSDNGTLQAIHA